MTAITPSSRLSPTRPDVGLLWCSLDWMLEPALHERGRAVATAGHVTALVVIPGQVAADVVGSDGSRYQVTLTFAGRPVPSSATAYTPTCTCPASRQPVRRGRTAARSRAPWCKHAIAAAYLAVDQHETGQHTG